MAQYIPKEPLVAEIEGLKSAAETMLTGKTDLSYWKAQKHLCKRLLSFLDTLEVKEVDNIWHTESEFSNVEPNRSILVVEDERTTFMDSPSDVRLFYFRPQNLKKWAYLDDLLNIANVQVKEVDLEKEFRSFLDDVEGMPRMWHSDEQFEWGKDIARHFFELGLKAQKGE